MEGVEGKSPCPNCETLVSKSDVYCRKCGAKLSGLGIGIPGEVSSEGVAPVEEVYVRRLSLSQRFLKLIVAPSEAMKDIAQAPSYDGISVIVIVEIILASIAAAMILQKFQITGPQSDTIMSLILGALTLSLFLRLASRVFKWVLKALIVRYTCDSVSSWDFKTAASITGYAYIAEIIVGMLGLFVGVFLLPTFYIDTSNWEVARQSLNDYQAQLMVLQLLYTLPLSLLGLLWKSYLGGLGTRFGTKEMCSLGRGFGVFFGLGLIGLLVAFVL